MTTPTPPPTERVLPGSGLRVQLAMPDLYSMISSAQLPNPLVAPILRMLENNTPSEDYTQGIIQARDSVLALYHIAHLCLVKPRLNLKGAAGPGEIGPADLRWDDLTDIYFNFFRGVPLAAVAPFTSRDDAADVVAAPPPRPGVPLSPIGDAGRD